MPRRGKGGSAGAALFILREYGEGVIYGGVAERGWNYDDELESEQFKKDCQAACEARKGEK